jgi:hypothetical protein
MTDMSIETIRIDDKRPLHITRNQAGKLERSLGASKARPEH